MNKEELRDMIVDLDLSENTIIRLLDKVDLVGEELYEIQERIDKAIEYIEKIMPGLRLSNQMYSYIKKHLLEILKGE